MRAERPECIDYIFLKGAVSCVHVEKWTEESDGVYLSDHYPVCAELIWESPEA
jgi:endonuclease/exonuclease/phosphatase family metal-dependent hydrolase